MKPKTVPLNDQCKSDNLLAKVMNKREDANYQYQEQNTMYNCSSLGIKGILQITL